MSKTLRLVRNYFDCFIGSFVSKKKKAKYSLGVLFVVLIGSLLIFTFANTSYLTTVEFVKAKAPILAMYMNLSMAIMMILLLTVMRSALPNKATDEELLLSMPISKTQIIFAKSFFNYLFDLFSLIGILLPSFIIYYYLVDEASILVIINGLIIILLIPLFSNALASFVGLLFQKISSSFRNYSLVQTVLILILLVGFMVFNYGIKGLLDNNVSNIEQFLNQFLPMKWFMTYVLDNNLISLFWIALICITTYTFSIFLKAMMLGRVQKNYQSKKTDLSFKERKPWYSLYLKELKNYFDLPIYIINTIIGSIFYLALAILITTLSLDKITYFLMSLQIPRVQTMIIPLVVATFCLLIATVSTTAPSISLEGKYIWILKAHPVNLRDIYLAKILVNLTVTFIPIFIGAPLIASTLGWQYLWIILLLPLLTSVIVAIYGLYFNLMFPKMTWESEVVPVKQSLSVIVVLFFSVVVIMLPNLIFFVFLPVKYLYFLFFNISYYILMIMLGIRLLFTSGKRYFEQL